MQYNDTAKGLFFYKDPRGKKGISHKLPGKHFDSTHHISSSAITAVLTMFDGSLVDPEEIDSYKIQALLLN